MVCLICMVCSGTYWLLGGAWFQCRYRVFWMSSYQLMFPEVRSSLVFSEFGLKPPASGFQSYSSQEASRLLHSYSTDYKTFRLIMKFLHSEGHPERYTELHGEEKREEGGRGDQEQKRGNQKGRE